MKLNQEHIFKSTFHDIQVVATEFDEPHPGHTIWRFKFMVNGILEENEHLNYKWSGLFPKLDNYVIEDENGEFIFIPTEGTTLLYEVSTNKYHVIPAGGETRNNAFAGNTFSEGRLVIVKERGLQIVSLDNMQIQNIQFPEGKYQVFSAGYIDDLLIVDFKDLSNYQEYKKRYNFDTMDFE